MPQNTSTSNKNKGSTHSEDYVRVRIPKPQRGEVLGVIEEHHGSKLLVRCTDGHTRSCRIPGKIRYKLRVKAGYVVLIKKWEIQSDEKGDYLYFYRKNQVSELINRGYLKKEFLENQQAETYS